MEAALIAKLLASAGVTALVSTRINWKVRPQGEALPAIVLHKPSAVPDYHHGGASGLVASRVQGDCWALSFGAALAVARAMEAALCGQSFVQGATRFDVILNVGEHDDTYTEPTRTLFRYSIDLMVHSANAS